MSALARALRRLLEWCRRPRPRLIQIEVTEEAHASLRRSAARAGMSLEEWGRSLLLQEVTADTIAQAAREDARDAALAAVHAAADRQDEIEVLLARCAAGEFTPEQWRQICAKYEA